MGVSSHGLLLPSFPHGVYVLTTWGIVVVSAINHDPFLCVISCKFPLCAPRRQAHESKQLKSRPLAHQHDQPLKRHQASSYGHEGFSTPGSRALAVAAGLKRPRPSTVPHHPLFCSPAQGNGRWGRDSRREVAGPYILTCYYSRVASSGLQEGAAQSRCMEIAAAHTNVGSTTTLPTHHGVASPWSQHVLLSPHFLSTIPLFSPSFTTDRPCGLSGGIPHPTLRVWPHHVPPAGRSATAWLSCVDEVKSLPAGNLPYRPLYPRLVICRGTGIIASSPSPKWTWRWTADLGRIGRIGPQD